MIIGLNSPTETRLLQQSLGNLWAYVVSLKDLIVKLENFPSTHHKRKYLGYSDKMT